MRLLGSMCKIGLLLLLQQQIMLARAISIGGFGDSSVSSNYLPGGLTSAGKLKAFLVCRKECIAKCDRLVYVYSAKKEFCHECLKQCISSVVQQARSLGVDFNAVTGDTEERRMQGDSPATSASYRGSGGGGGGRRRRREGEKRRQERRERRHQRRNRKKRRGADRGGGGKGKQRSLLKNCIVHK